MDLVGIMFPWHSKKYSTVVISEDRKKILKEHTQQYNIPLSDFELWDLALTHISHMDTNNGFSYERLEFLGDSILGLCLADILFRKYIDLSEGKMSMMKSSLANENTLALLGRELELLKVVKLGHGERLADERAQEKVLCDLFESTVAVIYLQHGFKKCKDFVEILLESHIDCILTEGLKDFKTKLQKVTMKVYKEYPVYEIIDTEGPDHGKIFTVKGTIMRFEASAKGRTKKEAEQNTAQIILQEMKEDLLTNANSLFSKELVDDE